jgi:hypothetical protein
MLIPQQRQAFFVGRKLMTNTKRQTLISQQKRDFNYYFVLLGGVFFILISVSGFNNRTENIYNPFWENLLFAVMGLTVVFYCFFADTIVVHYDKLEVITFYGRVKKTILKNEIICFNEIIKKTKYGNFKTLIIKTNEDKYKINASRYKNYLELRNEITEGQTKSDEIQENYDKQQSNFDSFVIIVGLLFFLAILLFQHFTK